MQYVHRNGMRYEPVFHELFHQERMVDNELALERGPFARGWGNGKSWEVVFEELNRILSPIQIQQLASCLLEDTRETCFQLHHMAEIEKILVGEFGGEG